MVKMMETWRESLWIWMREVLKPGQKRRLCEHGRTSGSAGIYIYISIYLYEPNAINHPQVAFFWVGLKPFPNGRVIALGFPHYKDSQYGMDDHNLYGMF